MLLPDDNGNVLLADCVCKTFLVAVVAAMDPNAAPILGKLAPTIPPTVLAAVKIFAGFFNCQITPSTVGNCPPLFL